MQRISLIAIVSILIAGCALELLSLSRLVAISILFGRWAFPLITVMLLIAGRMLLNGRPMSRVTLVLAIAAFLIFGSKLNVLSVWAPAFQHPYLSGFLLFSAIWMMAKDPKAVSQKILDSPPYGVLFFLAVFVSCRVYLDPSTGIWDYFALDRLFCDFSGWLLAATHRTNALGYTFCSSLWSVFWVAMLVGDLKQRASVAQRAAWLERLSLLAVFVILFSIIFLFLYPNSSYYRGYNRIRIGTLLPVASGCLGAVASLALAGRFRKLLSWTGVAWILCSIAVALSASLTALFALAAGAGVMSFENIASFVRSRGMRKKTIVLQSWAAIGLVVVALFGVSLFSHKNYFFRYYAYHTYYSRPDTNQAASRISYYRWGIDELIHHPVLGLGPQWGLAYETDHRTNSEASLIAHSQLLDLGLMAGVGATLSCLLLLGTLITHSIRHSKGDLRQAAVVTAVGVTALFTSIQSDPVALSILFLIVFANVRCENPKRRPITPSAE